MNTAASRNIFDDVKARIEIRNFIEDYSKVKLLKKGKSYGGIRCPLCNANESFFVNSSDNVFNCFSCKKGGSAIDYLVHLEDKDTLEAAKEIAGYLKLNLADYEPKKKNDQKGKDDPIQTMWEFAASHYAQHRKGCKEAEHLTKPKAEGGRGHKEGSLQRLGVGWTSGKLHKLLAEKGHSEEEILSSGLVMKDEEKGHLFDYFGTNLYVFPWRDEEDKIGYWSAKDPAKKRKGAQLRSEFKKKNLLWGNQKAMRGQEVHIVEGEDDLLSMCDAGASNTICSMGSVSQAQIDWVLVNRYSITKDSKGLFFWFDRDIKWKNGQPPAGLRYVRNFYQPLLNQGHEKTHVCSGHLEPGEDVDDFIQKDLTTAAARVKRAKTQPLNPISYEFLCLPPWVIDNDVVSTEALINYLDDIEFWQYLGLLPEMHRDAVVGRLSGYSISRDSVMGRLKQKASLLHTISALNESTPKKEQKEESHQRRIAMAIWDSFKMRGLFFIVENTSVMLFFGHKIYTIDDNTEFRALMHRECGLNSTVALYKYVKAELEALCFNQGEHMSQFSWIHRVREGDNISLYSNLKDKENRILKLSNGDIQLIENGVNDDKVLLQPSTKMQPFTYDAAVDVPSALGDLKRIFLDSMSCEMYQRYFLLAHAFAPFFIPFTKAKALAKCEGGSGSGKTTGARFAGLLLMGKDIVGKTSTAAAYSMGSREPMMVFDNIENHNLNLEFLDFLLLVSTGSTRDKRSQGSDSGIVSEELNTIVWITGIEPFSKPELINRTFTIKFDPKYRRKDQALMGDLMEELLEKRDSILSALLQVLAREVLPTIQDRRRYWVNHIRGTFPDHSKERMDEYIATLLCLIEALIKYLPLPKTPLDFIPEGKNHTAHILEKWLGYQDRITGESESESNQVLEALNRFRDSAILRFSAAEAEGDAQESQELTHYGLKVVKNSGYNGRGIGQRDAVSMSFVCSAAQLLTAFKTSAKDSGSKCPFVSANQLSARYNDQKELLIKSGWSKEHKKKINGTNHFEFEWVEEIEE